MHRLTADQRALREQIRLLSAHIRETRREHKAIAKAAEKAARPSPHVARAATHLNRLRSAVERFETDLNSTDGDTRLYAQGELSPARLALAGFVRNHPTMPEAADLVPWALKYLAEREATMARHSEPLSR